MLPALAPIIIGSVASAILGKQANDANARAQAQANASNERNVDKQLAFQDEQSRTQYQRAVADLKAAGLNPALAYKQGGNQSMGGAAAQNQAYTGRTSAGERMVQAMEAYNNFANSSAQREMIREQTDVARAQAFKTRVEATALHPEAALGEDNEYTREYRRTRMAELGGRIHTATNTEKRLAADLAATEQGINTGRAQQRLLSSQATLNEQEFTNEWFRKNVAPYLNSSAKVLRTAKGVEELAWKGSTWKRD